jgi:hypothetical protein
MQVTAFVSCKFPPDEAVKQICEMLKPDITPYVSQDVKVGALPEKLRENIAKQDCLVVILTKAGSSEWVQNEVGIAFALRKPVFAIYEESVSVSGLQPYVSTSITYREGNVAQSATQINLLKEAAKREIEARDIAGSPEELIAELRNNGVIGIYPNRAAAFRVFQKRWEREHVIQIVGSTMEGFERGIGIPANKLIASKLTNDPQSRIQVLLTHGDFAKQREKPENEPDGYIFRQMTLISEMLTSVRDRLNAGERLQWRYFKGAPTCFMIVAGSFMLLNPYLYMKSAIHNFAMLVRKTESLLDIYNRYLDDHFQLAWDHPTLTTREGGFVSSRQSPEARVTTSAPSS